MPKTLIYKIFFEGRNSVNQTQARVNVNKQTVNNKFTMATKLCSISPVSCVTTIVASYKA